MDLPGSGPFAGGHRPRAVCACQHGRYRLRRVCDVIGWDPRCPREAFVLQTALVVAGADQRAGRRAGASAADAACGLPHSARFVGGASPAHRGVWKAGYRDCNPLPWTGLPDARVPGPLAGAARRRASGWPAQRCGGYRPRRTRYHVRRGNHQGHGRRPAPHRGGRPRGRARPVRRRARHAAPVDTARRPAIRSARSRQPRWPGSSSETDALLFVRERANNMAAAAAATPTGMSAVVGGDPARCWPRSRPPA